MSKNIRGFTMKSEGATCASVFIKDPLSTCFVTDKVFKLHIGTQQVQTNWAVTKPCS